MSFEYLPRDVQELVDLAITKPVEDGVPHLSRVHQVVHPQDGELLRHGKALNEEGKLHLADALLAFAKELQESDPRRMAERLEQLRLETPHGFGHTFGDS